MENELKSKEELWAEQWKEFLKIYERRMTLFKIGLFFSLIGLAACMSLIIIFMFTI